MTTLVPRDTLALLRPLPPIQAQPQARAQGQGQGQQVVAHGQLLQATPQLQALAFPSLSPVQGERDEKNK